MGRVFTTLFEFKGERHVAIVTVSEEHTDNRTFQVRLLNKAFYHLIPEGKLYFTSNDNLLPSSVTNRAAAEVFYSIKRAIQTYLSKPTSA